MFAAGPHQTRKKKIHLKKSVFSMSAANSVCIVNCLQQTCSTCAANLPQIQTLCSLQACSDFAADMQQIFAGGWIFSVSQFLWHIRWTDPRILTVETVQWSTHETYHFFKNANPYIMHIGSIFNFPNKIITGFLNFRITGDGWHDSVPGNVISISCYKYYNIRQKLLWYR